MKTQRGYTLFELIVLIGLFVGFSLLGFALYVIVHFIAKFW